MKINMNNEQKKLMVEIAKDTIAQIKAKKYIAWQGIYCQFPRRDALCNKQGKELRDVLPEISTCNVCAKGAIFLSLISKKDDFTLNSTNHGTYYINRYSLADRLKKDFDSNMLNLIEVAFELEERYLLGVPIYFVSDEKINSPEVKAATRAVKFGRRFKTSQSRLVGIMKNIIKNKGIFKP